MAKEKQQNKEQAIQWPNKKVQNKVQAVLYLVPFLWPLDCIYFILYLFFCHWIACTLFCTFSLASALKYKRKYKQSND
jgi:hypothetical protein